MRSDLSKTEAPTPPGVAVVTYDKYYDGSWQENQVPVPQEMSLTIYVNGEELVSILCTPVKLNCLVIGFLYSEGIIKSVTEISTLRVCVEDSLADVRLNRVGLTLPQRRTITSGCGGGVEFESAIEDMVPVDSGETASTVELLSLMRQMYERAEIFQSSGGVHTSALADNRNIKAVSEDIGRHNTLDKILGECLLLNIPTRGKIILTTGRISSEMLLKAARMEIPIIVSRSSPTDRSIALASKLGITLIGYARSTRLSVYSHPERITKVSG